MGQTGHARNHSGQLNLKPHVYLDHDQHVLKNVGWGTDKSNLRQDIDIKCLAVEDQPFKTSWDHDKTRI